MARGDLVESGLIVCTDRLGIETARMKVAPTRYVCRAGDLTLEQNAVRLDQRIRSRHAGQQSLCVGVLGILSRS
jgi:hypothetical protein